MPTYEFRCANGHEFEQFYRTISSAKHTVECPVCGLPAERLVSGGAGLVFKGSGFYVTDYARSGSQKSDGSKSSDSSSKSDAPAKAADSSSAASGTSSKKAD